MIIVKRGKKVLLSGVVTKFAKRKRKNSEDDIFFVTLQGLTYDEDMGVDMPCSYNISFFDAADGLYGPQKDATNASKMITKIGSVVMVRATENRKIDENGDETIYYAGTQVIFPSSEVKYKLSEDSETGEVYKSTVIYTGVALPKQEEKDGVVTRTISLPIRRWSKEAKENITIWLTINNVDEETIRLLTPTEADLNKEGKPRHKSIAVEFNKPLKEEGESISADWADKKIFCVLEKPKYGEKEKEA